MKVFCGGSVCTDQLTRNKLFRAALGVLRAWGRAGERQGGRGRKSDMQIVLSTLLG